MIAGPSVPVQAQLGYLEAVGGIGDFLAGFPGVQREEAVALLERSHSLPVTEAA